MLCGRCVELFGTDEPFLPWIEALRGGCEGEEGPHFLKVMRERAPTWLAQMPRFMQEQERAAIQREVFGATRERMVREFCDFIDEIGAERTWLIILEDLHWSDFATLDLLSRVARRPQRARALILATYRPFDFLTSGHPVRNVHQDLEIHGCSAELCLDRFSEEEVERYLALRFQNQTTARGFAKQLYGRTQGHPLFVVSLTDHLIAQRAIASISGGWRFDETDEISQQGVPRNLREMITRQIESLTRDEQRVLETGAAIGKEFAASLVAGALNLDVVDVETVCEALARKSRIIVSAGMVEWPNGAVAGVYAFQTALYQEVLSQRIAPGQRARMHRCFGEMLENGYGEQSNEIASQLALHFEEGRDYAKAVRYLGTAAASAAKRFSAPEAVSYLTRALGLAERLSEELRAKARAKLLSKRGWVRWYAGDLAEGLEDIEAVVDGAAEMGDLSLEVRNLMALSTCTLFADRPRCLGVTARTAERARDLNDSSLKALAEGFCALIRTMLTGWTEADVQICRGAFEMTADAQHPLIPLPRWSIAGILDYVVGDYRACRRSARQVQKLAQTQGDIYDFALFNSLEAHSLLFLGEWRELQLGLQAALAMTEKNTNLMATALCRLSIAHLYIEAFDFASARRSCEAAIALKANADPFNFFICRSLLAKVHLELGELRAARGQIDAVIDRIEKDGVAMELQARPYFLWVHCDYWLAVGDPKRAREQAKRLCETAEPAGNRHYLSLAQRSLGIIAMAESDLEAAETHLANAIAIVEGTELPLAAWRVYLSPSKLHARKGDAARAAEFHARAEKIIEHLAANFGAEDPLRRSLLAGFLTVAGPVEAAHAPLRGTPGVR